MFFKNQLAVYTFEIVIFLVRLFNKALEPNLVSVVVGVVSVQFNHKQENLLYHLVPVITYT